MPQYVWYACYGSNLLLKRFLCYLKGGTAPGGLLPNPGARDDADPIEIRPYKIDRPLYFAEQCQQWQNGGVGFLESAPVFAFTRPADVPRHTSEHSQQPGGVE